VSEALLEGAALEVGDDVLVLGGSAALVFGAHGRVGDGWVYAVEAEVGRLESLLGAAHAQGIAGLAYLVGGADVLPLPDGAVAAVVGSPFAGVDDPAEAARELHRVLRVGGRLSIADADAAAEAAVRAAGFADLARADGATAPQLTARKR
jgi:ubiquinone/menaquinone biosynthesis C-methylase UbiE